MHFGVQSYLFAYLSFRLDMIVLKFNCSKRYEVPPGCSSLAAWLLIPCVSLLQEDRRTRQQKKSQAKAKKVVATQKSPKANYNRTRRQQSKIKAKARAAAAEKENAKATSQVKASVPFERIVSVSE